MNRLESKEIKAHLSECLEVQLKRFRSVFGLAALLSIAAIALTYISNPERLVAVGSVCIVALVFVLGIMAGLLIADTLVKRET